ncbi:hypothetical protein AERYTH_00125 [Aeromicrobium erythreum]|uniref:Uncharacterized protein n=1 Tax=Aeromicrobium erythreum TaxID=2041 RepID=A0A0U4C5M1_9ACTN|nr:hypothetical protein AERYTH_00125 [Aeromicrobium erythreum]
MPRAGVPQRRLVTAAPASRSTQTRRRSTDVCAGLSGGCGTPCDGRDVGRCGLALGIVDETPNCTVRRPPGPTPSDGPGVVVRARGS